MAASEKNRPENGQPDKELPEAEGVEQSLESPEAPESKGRFARWRAERERVREAEIEREQQIAERENRRRAVLEDPALEGLRAEEGASVSSRGATRARSLAPTWRRWLYGSLTLLVAAAIFVGVVFFSPLIAVQTITVRGGSLLDNTQVASQLQQLKGVPLARINEQRILDIMGEDNALQGVHVQIRPPHELVVTIQERVPVAVVKVGEQYSIVDSHGAMLRTVAKAEDARVPLIDTDGVKPAESEKFKTIATALSAIPVSMLEQMKSAQAQNSSSISFTLKDNVNVLWGTATDNEVKAKVLSSLLTATASRKDQGASSAIARESGVIYDVSAPNFPVIRTSQAKA